MDENLSATVHISGIPVSIAHDIHSHGDLQQQPFNSSSRQPQQQQPSTSGLMSSSSLSQQQQDRPTANFSINSGDFHKSRHHGLPGGSLLLGSNSNSDVTMQCCEHTEAASSSGGDAGGSRSQIDEIVPEDLSMLSEQYLEEREKSVDQFREWTEAEQVDYVESLLNQMCHYQHGQINTFLKPMLQRDFISTLPERGLPHIAETILSYLDSRSLCRAELVCREWYRVIQQGHIWQRLIERNVKTDSLWRGLSERRGWGQFLKRNAQKDAYYRGLYPVIVQDIEKIEDNWRRGNYDLKKIQCRSDNSKGVYCLQYDDDKIVSGLRDNTIKLWDRKSLENTKVLTGHTGSVLCLQYDEDVIITGSSDSTVRVWDVKTGKAINTLVHHCEAVLHLRFDNGLMVTCSKDRSIAVWDMVSPTEINMRRVLVGHRAAVNVVDFDDKYIVSASGDRTIKVWVTSSCEFVRTLNGHKRGIACLQYRDQLVVSGSSDNTIRLWDIESGACLRILEGHEELVRCIRFDGKRIVSGAYDGKIKVWDLQAALDQRSPPHNLCIQTLMKHRGRVLCLQFDEFQIVSSSHDDSILIWDFLNVEHLGLPATDAETADASADVTTDVDAPNVVTKDDSTTDVTVNVHPADVSTEAAHILADVEAADALKIEDNWRRGNYDLKKIQCRSNNSKGVKCLQYDDDKIVSGLRDNTIKFWDRKSLENTKVLTGHTGSVLCLQYDEDVIITGSSDSTVRVWDVKT